jgi:hypothetical protein
MPLFTSLLLFTISVALLLLALRTSRAGEARRHRLHEEERMTISAKICEAAARDAFGVELDHSMESIILLDSLITNGWSKEPISAEDLTKGNTPFIFAAYLGDVFVHHAKAQWQWNNDEGFLYFQNLKRTALPFELIKQKLNEPSGVDLAKETSLWLNPLAQNNSDRDSNE